MRKKISFIFKIIPILVVVVAVWGGIKLLSSSQGTDKEDVAYSSEFNHRYAVFAVDLPEEVDFAGEKIPTQFTDVRESLDREILVNTYWQSQTLLFFKRANKYFPIIEPILKKNNIPDDFKYLAMIESGLTNVVSPTGATGFWQFLKATAQEYDLEVNDEIDERYDIRKSTEAACKYLNESYAKYKNWCLVAATYNMGKGGLDKILDAQKESNYFDLLLNEETGRYVYRIAAVKIILSNPEMYGFHFRKKDLYEMIPTEEVKIDTVITDLVEFAQVNNTNYKILKYLNPWLRKSTLPTTSNKEYTILIPEKNGRSLSLENSQE